jgi:hypothetical protein
LAEEARLDALLQKDVASLRAAMAENGAEQYDLCHRSLSALKSNALHEKEAALIAEAEALMVRLEHVHLLAKRVKELNSATFAELKSFVDPLPEILAVMQCTFLLLGSKFADVKTWKQVKIMLSKMGKDSVKRRISDFNPLHAKVGGRALKKAAALLKGVSVARIESVSIGGTVFYAYCDGILQELTS